jgi:protein tyrosine/serine phosphatase
MFKRLQNWLEGLERSWRESFGLDISTPEGRRDAWRHFMIADHAALRVFWTNFYPVAPGVFRANQPSPKRLENWKERGIKAVLNLRGSSPYSPYLFESEACSQLGLPLTDINLSATELPSLDIIRELEHHFRTLEKPFVMHCKSGADRAGFASALYLLLVEGRPVEVAQKQLGLKFAHMKHSAKGVLDFGLEKYRLANEASPLSFRDWLETMYDPKAIYDEFHAARRKRG